LSKTRKNFRTGFLSRAFFWIINPPVARMFLQAIGTSSRLAAITVRRMLLGSGNWQKIQPIILHRDECPESF
jgi:hypothetical protein